MKQYRNSAAGGLLGGAIAALLSLPAAAADDAVEWGYSGAHGPEHWGGLAPEFALCEAGLNQSPIDLGSPGAIGDLEVAVDYAAAPLVLMNNGKTIQAEFAPGSYMTSGGKVYALLQVHLHTPSEHTVDGMAYPLTAHFVHGADDGALAVLGVMYEAGEANAELAKLIDAAGSAGSEAKAVAGVTLDPVGLLPDEIEVFRYMGSLTTPPCSEGVNWHVVEEPAAASPEQLERLAAMMGDNARPVMPLNGRLLVAPE